MNRVIAGLLLLSSFVAGGEIEIGTPEFESLNPFCH